MHDAMIQKVQTARRCMMYSHFWRKTSPPGSYILASGRRCHPNAARGVQHCIHICCWCPLRGKLPDVAAVAMRMRHIRACAPQTTGPLWDPGGSGSSTYNRGSAGLWAGGEQCKGSTWVCSSTLTRVSKVSYHSFALAHRVGGDGQVPCLFSSCVRDRLPS